MSNTESYAPRKPSSYNPEVKKVRNVYGSGKFRWAVYPDYWKEKWGRKPLLGYVFADDEFYAEREAYSRGLLHVNFTIRPEVVNVGVAKVLPPRTGRY